MTRQRPAARRPPVRGGGRVASEAGAGTPEYVAVMIVIGAIVAALVAAPIAPTIGDWAQYAVCQLFGDDCERPVAGAAGGPTPTPASMTCLEGREREQLGGSVTLFSVKASGDLAYQIDRTSDGHHDVTLEVSGGLAAELVAGGKLSADALGVRQGRQGAIELGGEATVAPVFRFDSQAAAVAFAEQARELATGPIDDLVDWRTLVPVWGTARIPANQVARIRDFEAPPPSRLRVEGGIQLEGSGSLYGSGGGVDGVLSAGETLGADIDLEKDEVTVYVALDGELAATLGLGPATVPGAAAPSGSGSVEGEVALALTLDSDRQPTKLALGATATGNAGLGGALDGMLFAGSPFGAIQPDLDAAVAAFDIDARSERTAALSAKATLDLTDPRAAEIGNDLLTALASRDEAALAASGVRLADHLATETDLEAQLHVGSRDLFDLGASGGKGLAFGLGVAHENSSMELAGAWMRPAGDHFQRGYCS